MLVVAPQACCCSLLLLGVVCTCSYGRAAPEGGCNSRVWFACGRNGSVALTTFPSVLAHTRRLAFEFKPSLISTKPFSITLSTPSLDSSFSTPPMAQQDAQDAVAKAMDPNSSFPEKPLDSPEQQKEIRGFLGPETHKGMTNVDDMVERPPVAGKRGQGDLKGDMVEGINRSVGAAIGSVGDTESGRKGTGGVDISNAAGSGV